MDVCKCDNHLHYERSCRSESTATTMNLLVVGTVEASAHIRAGVSEIFGEVIVVIVFIYITTRVVAGVEMGIGLNILEQALCFV